MKKLYAFILVPFLALQLSGCAGFIVAGAATAVYVVTDPRSNSELLNDQDISLQIGALGNKAPLSSNVRVTASTFRGNTLLMGQAVTQSYKDQVEAETRKIKGVKVVYNQLKVKPLLTISDISNDTWITTKVKSSLISDPDLRDLKITVYTEDSEVFLVGSVTQTHADKAVDIARNISGVKKVIKVFYYGQSKKAEQETRKPAPTEDLTSSPNPSSQSAVASKPTIKTQEAQKVTEEVNEEIIPYIEPEEVKPL